jgi:hypothetical protein
MEHDHQWRATLELGRDVQIIGALDTVDDESVHLAGLGWGDAEERDQQQEQDFHHIPK